MLILTPKLNWAKDFLLHHQKRFFHNFENYITVWITLPPYLNSVNKKNETYPRNIRSSRKKQALHKLNFEYKLKYITCSTKAEWHFFFIHTSKNWAGKKETYDCDMLWATYILNGWLLTLEFGSIPRS